MFPRINSRTSIRPIGMLLVLACGLFGGPLFADQMAIPGTSVSLDAPDGFTVATMFSGLQNMQDGSSIAVNEMPAEAYDQLLPVFSDLDAANSRLRPRGIQIDRIHSYAIGQQEVRVLIGSQSGSGGVVGKYLALYRGDVTVMLSFNVFDPHSLTPAVVEHTIQSVKLASAATLQQKIERLPFSFRVTTPFRVGDVLGGATVLLPSFEGTDATGLRPVVIIGRALSAIDPASDTESVARRLLRGTQGFEDAETVRIEAADFGGGAGVYLAAVAGKRTVVQYLRVPPDGVYIRLIAFGDTTELGQVMPAITEIAASVVKPR